MSQMKEFVRPSKNKALVTKNAKATGRKYIWKGVGVLDRWHAAVDKASVPKDAIEIEKV